MIIELPHEIEHLGQIALYGVQKVFELDSGLGEIGGQENPLIRRISYGDFERIQKQMAIVVSIRNEHTRLLEGVLYGIPHNCLTIIVSNSSREPSDRFYFEQECVFRNKRFSQKNIIIVHQKDRVLAEVFANAGYPELLNEWNLIKDGKAEGMILGILLARLSGRKYIGFLDADNYIPGSVNEYIREYIAGLLISKSPYAMVRILWHSKPKIQGSRLFFAKFGRTSIHTNLFLNKLVSYHTGFGTEIIKTGNSGEHAMSTELAMRLGYSSASSLEVYHFIYLMEKFGGFIENSNSAIIPNPVELYQIESRNPHLHELKSKEHVKRTSYQSLQVIYHSRVCPELLRQELLQEMTKRGFINVGEEPAHPIFYPPLTTVDLSTFMKGIQDRPYAELLNLNSVKPENKVANVVDTERDFHPIPQMSKMSS